MCEKRKERQKDRLENGGWRAHKLQIEERILHTHIISYGSRLMLYHVLLCENLKSQRSLIVLHVISDQVLYDL